MLTFIKNRFAQKELAQLEVAHQREVCFKNFDQIKHILLLCSIEELDQIKTLKRAAELLRSEKKEVNLTVLYPQKEMTDAMLIEHGVNFLTLKDTNWKDLFVPQNISSITDTFFDLVIDFSTKKSLAISQLALLSKAPLITGRDIEETIADFTIKIPSDKDETFLAEQIIFYLRTIKSK